MPDDKTPAPEAAKTNKKKAAKTAKKPTTTKDEVVDGQPISLVLLNPDVGEIEGSAIDLGVLKVEITSGQIDNWFSHHAPDDEAIAKHERIRKAGAAFAQIIKDNTPNCDDQSHAIRKVREAVMTANAAIACRGR